MGWTIREYSKIVKYAVGEKTEFDERRIL